MTDAIDLLLLIADRIREFAQCEAHREIKLKTEQALLQRLKMEQA